MTELRNALTDYPDLPVNRRDLQNTIVGVISSVAGPLKNLIARVEALEVESKESEIVRDENGRAKGLRSGTASAKALRARIAALEAQVAALTEQTKGVRYAGTWKSGTQYAADSFVTCDGSLWVAKTVTADKPGKSSNWQLAIKSGRK